MTYGSVYNSFNFGPEITSISKALKRGTSVCSSKVRITTFTMTFSKRNFEISTVQLEALLGATYQLSLHDLKVFLRGSALINVSDNPKEKKELV